MREFMGFMADSKIAAPPGGRDVLHKYVRAPKVFVSYFEMRFK